MRHQVLTLGTAGGSGEWQSKERDTTNPIALAPLLLRRVLLRSLPLVGRTTTTTTTTTTRREGLLALLLLLLRGIVSGGGKRGVVVRGRMMLVLLLLLLWIG